MTLREQVLLVMACALTSVAYMTPTFIAIARQDASARRVFIVNGLLGWTIVGWLVAARLAARPHRPTAITGTCDPWMPGRPEAAGRAMTARSTYVEGTYLISQQGDARTWAICSGGRWGIAFELGGVQRTSAWVDATDVPLEVLAHALAANSERRA